jgi:hypothetical protein
VSDTAHNDAQAAQATSVAEAQAETLSASLHEAADDVKAEIIQLLETYPYVSRSMIQVGLGPACPPKLWGPVLQALVDSGEVKLENMPVTTPKGRTLNKVIMHLKKFPWPVTIVEVGSEISTPSA